MRRRRFLLWDRGQDGESGKVESGGSLIGLVEGKWSVELMFPLAGRHGCYSYRQADDRSNRQGARERPWRMLNLD